MYKLKLLAFLLTATFTSLFGQNEVIPLQANNWEINTETMKFAEHNGVSSLLIDGSGLASIKGISFHKGTIEFDYYATGQGFCGIYFRKQEGETQTPTFSSEFFYLRSFKIDDAMVPGSVQYAPIIRGTNLWDLLHDYEANALIKSESWNKVRLVVSQEQMKCYVNGEMVLWISELLGPQKAGGISFEGNGVYANIRIAEGSTEDVPESKGADVTAHDVRFLRDWVYGLDQDLPRSNSLRPEMFPDSVTVWNPISAGRAGLINLTKEISSPFIEGKRRVVWLETTIDSDSEQVKKLSLGFSDDIWVYVNGSLLHIDQNTYGQAIAKQPNGRLHIENTIINLPLSTGQNKIRIALANDFFGWGLVARLDNMRGITDKMTH